MAVYLSTMVNNEIGLLRVKLEEAWDHVDCVYVAECAHTFTGDPKPLYLKEAWETVREFEDKLEHVTVDSDPLAHPRANEARLRNSAMPPDLRDDDVLFCCDVDEIEISCQYPSLINMARRMGVMRLLKRSFFYRANLLAAEVHPWSVVARGDQVKRCPDLDTLRQSCVPAATLTLGGHFTYMMSPEEIATKIRGGTHTELDRPEFTSVERIRQRIEQCQDPFDRQSLSPVALDATFPAAFHRAEWRPWIHAPAAQED